MKAVINREDCIACELCVSICPEVFRMGEDGPAEVYVEVVPKTSEKAAVEAMESCPVSVITIE